MVEISHDLALLDNTIGREFEIFMVKLFEKLGFQILFLGVNKPVVFNQLWNILAFPSFKLV